MLAISMLVTFKAVGWYVKFHFRAHRLGLVAGASQGGGGPGGHDPPKNLNRGGPDMFWPPQYLKTEFFFLYKFEIFCREYRRKIVDFSHII